MEVVFTVYLSLTHLLKWVLSCYQNASHLQIKDGQSQRMNISSCSSLLPALWKDKDIFVVEHKQYWQNPQNAWMLHSKPCNPPWNPAKNSGQKKAAGTQFNSQLQKHKTSFAWKWFFLVVV